MINVGLIGYGYAGRVFHGPLIDGVAGMRLAAIASARAAEVARDRPGARVVADWGELLRDAAIDLVVVATPNDSHFEIARAAILAGKHVVVEKPFALDLAQARGLAELARAKGVLLAVFHNRRWDSDFLTVRRVIESGELGRVVHFESHFDRFRPAVRQRWREGSGVGAGIWYDLAPHLVDQALMLFGVPDGVSAELAVLRDGGLADDWAHAVLDYPDKRVILHCSMLVAGGSPRFVVHGDRGSLVKRLGDRQEAQLLAGVKPGSADWGVDPDEAVRWDGEGGEHRVAAVAGDQRGFYQAVVAALRGEGVNPTPSYQSLAVMAVIEAGMKSAASGTRMGLALTDEEIQGWKI